jgi:hypothetical protein
VLPPEWGRVHAGPRRFDLVSQGLAVRERYRPLGNSAQLDEVFDVALGAGADFVYIDRPYVDFDYRSDLSHFYGRSFRPPPETTERLIFATKDRIIGISAIRPLPQHVGRTMLAPPAEEAPYVTCVARMPVHAFGFEWTVSGYPFTSQDGEYGVCAHAALWSIARYHHLRFGTDRHTTTSIIEAAGLKERPDKTARSDGMYGFDVVRAFRGIGLPALQYDVDSIPATSQGTETADSVICRYLNSGIPVCVLTLDHMIVLIGYAEAANGDITYVVSDDNLGAYQRMNLVSGTTSDAWKLLVIPQPGRMHVNGEAAEARAEETFEDRVRANTGPGHLLPRWLGGELRVRTYATPSYAYVNNLIRRGVPDAVRHHHIYAPKGNWLWIAEFQDMKLAEDERVIGEIAIDATSFQYDPSPIFGNIDGWAYLWAAGEDEPSVAELAPGSSGFRSALGDRTVRPAPAPRSFTPYAGTPIQ